MENSKIINGKILSEELSKDLFIKVLKLKKEKNIVPTLAVILVGNDFASHIYVNNKLKAIKNIEMNSINFTYPNSISELELIEKIRILNIDKNIHGILVQFPLPEHINEISIADSIIPSKDVDGFNSINIGKLFIGQKDGFIPCTPLGIIKLLKTRIKDLSGLNVIVIGRSNIVGKPIAQLLLNENCTVTIAHSKTKNLSNLVKNFDIVICAIGIPKFIKGNWLKKDCIVIDVGINRLNSGKLCGDCDFDECIKITSAITPVPGGVGPMTIFCLLENLYKACNNLTF